MILINQNQRDLLEDLSEPVTIPGDKYEAWLARYGLTHRDILFLRDQSAINWSGGPEKHWIARGPAAEQLLKEYREHNVDRRRLAEAEKRAKRAEIRANIALAVSFAAFVVSLLTMALR